MAGLADDGRWHGESPEDIRAYLKAYADEEHPLHEWRLNGCACGSSAFSVDVDAEQGLAIGICAGCGTAHALLDSDDHWQVAEAGTLSCQCGGQSFNCGVAFSLETDLARVNWAYFGVRCTQCGVLDSAADWRVGQGPTAAVLERTWVRCQLPDAD